MQPMPPGHDATDHPTPTPRPSSSSLLPQVHEPAILLVDDEPLQRRIVAAMLRQRGGVVVAEAGDGNEALAALSVRRFDILITDLQMPGMDGHELLLRVQDEYPLLRRIVITGYTTLENALEALKLGCVGLAPKPVRAEVLDDLVNLALTEVRLWQTQLAAMRRLKQEAG